MFFTNYGSRKAAQIKDNPEVALLFPWFSMGRQVSVTGPASRISSAVSLKYFLRGAGEVSSAHGPLSRVL
ncbi:MAG: hypothetical protein Ct9H300mP16_19600 [Pseudomonadota bacterium]|nr:MAG: hypothetical protein Ct9H300mP16_19600 [Pseudomonadota bacterium]